MINNLRQTASPDHFTEKELSETSWKTLVVKFFAKEEVVIRYLVSKIVYTDESISLEETVALFTAFESLIQKMARHPVLQQKYGSELFIFRAIFSSLENLRTCDPRTRREQLESTYSFYRGKLFSRRFYFSVKGQVQKFFIARIKTRFPKKFPPKAFIGKGYGDHGTAKDVSLDGSPGWEEVASVLISRNESYAIYTILDKEAQLFSDFRIHDEQVLGRELVKS